MWKYNTAHRKHLFWSLLVLGCTVLIVGVIIFPYIWMVLSSFKPKKEIFALPPTLIPSSFTLQNYIDLFHWGGFEKPLVRIFVNSMGIGVISAILSTFIGSLAGYSFARLNLPAGRLLLTLVIISQLFPPISLIIPIFIIMRNLGLLDTWLALILPYTAFRIVFVMWIMSGFFREIPQEMEDAAFLDGCSTLGAFIRVMLPLSVPALAACAVLSFIFCWNEFMFALILTFTPLSKTLPVVAAEAMTSESIEWGILNATGSFIAVPSLIFTFIAQRFIVRGLTSGAVKG